jgi:hypothetical protein
MTTKIEHGNELHDDCKICIMNQAYLRTTRIVFYIQKIVTLLSVAPATKNKKQTAQMECHRMLMMIVIRLQHKIKLANQFADPW